MYTRTEIEKQILAEFAKVRSENERTAKTNLERAKADKDFFDTFTKIKDLEFDIAEQEYKNQDTTKLKSDLTKLKKQLKQITVKLGFTENDFQPKFNCNNCHDTGFVGNSQCNCFRSRVNEELIKASGLEIAKLNTFDDFDANISHDASHKELLNKLKTQLISYAQKFPKTRATNILISGPTGVGKTFALECTASEILKRGFTVNFLTSFQLNNQFLRYHGCYDANKQSYLNILLEPDLLVIDDLGTEPMFNNVTKEYLYLIISERMLKSKGTMISTNLTPSNIIDRYGERVFSRLFDKTKSILIRIDGNDLRRLKRS